jgi:hypothetical protein
MQGDVLVDFLKLWGVPGGIALFLVWHLNSNFNNLLKQLLEAQKERTEALKEQNAVQREDANEKAKLSSEMALLRQEVWSLKDRFNDDREKLPRG